MCDVLVLAESSCVYKVLPCLGLVCDMCNKYVLSN